MDDFHQLELLKAVVAKIIKDDAIGDYTAIDYLFKDLTPQQLKEFVSQTAQGRFDSATSICPCNEQGFTDYVLQHY